MGTPEVRVTGGTLAGSWESRVAVFRGIPYAAPPVGANRFAAPRPAPGWAGVRPALEYGPPVPQSELLGSGTGGPAGDDWLTVNVWTPEPGPAARLPVLVWLHGGGYMFGKSGAPEYDGGHLARDGHLVVVTLNYRLGFEGFAHLTGAPGNRGLLDQIAALQWVRRNVAAFGGDPSRVTIFGESAGGGCVAALLAMPGAAGLFRGAVVQSMPGPFFAPELAADVATACAAEVGRRPEAADLADVDPALLVRVGDAITATAPQRVSEWGVAAYRSIVFSPVVDGDTLPTDPWQALAAGAARDVALLAGHTRDEHRLFTLFTGPPTPEQAAEALDLLAPGDYRAAYPHASPAELHELVLSDWLFRMPTIHLADAQVAGGGRAHFYELTWEAPGLGGTLGACHGLDVPLVFGNLTSGQPALLLGDTPGPDALALSAEMRAAWATFAASGDPGWPAYTRGEQLTRVFDGTGAVTAYPEKVSYALWPSATA